MAKKTKLTPFGARVLVLQDEAETITPSGIVLPTNTAARPYTGVVVAVGEESAVPLKTRVVFNRYAGIEVEHDGKPHLLMTKDDLLASVS